MNCYDKRLKDFDPFPQRSTYQDDFKRYCYTQKEVHYLETVKGEKPQKPSAKYHFEDHETFATWREGAHIPFDLYTKNELPINGETIRKQDEDAKQQAIKTRPRVYMTPSVSMDDIPDPNIREFLCNNMYTSIWRKAEKEANANWVRIIPTVSKVDQTNSVNLQVNLFPPINEKFTRKAKEWEDNQRRGSSDPTREFWIHKNPPVICGACVNPLYNIVPQDTRNQIAEAIKEDNLRLAHDYPGPTYAGYRPIMAMGVDISRTNLPATHPYITTSQAITSRYAEYRRATKGCRV